MRALVRMKLPPPPHGAEDAPSLPHPYRSRLRSYPQYIRAHPRAPPSPRHPGTAVRPAVCRTHSYSTPRTACSLRSLRRARAPHMAVAGMQMPLSVSLPAAKAAGRLSARRGMRDRMRAVLLAVSMVRVSGTKGVGDVGFEEEARVGGDSAWILLRGDL
ncbi:hypothetical protein DFH06DRAFT_447160 [Mycena polygramma]|nr:hypothetical protein DFH06DRAFT_447160 [Mycena polygramma]